MDKNTPEPVRGADPYGLPAERMNRWLRELEARHLRDLRFSDVTRALRALSSAYVSREPGALSRQVEGTGKRAAFAMVYGPLHFLTVRAILQALPGALYATGVLDIGCGTGVAGAAWASATVPQADVLGIDTQAWTLDEAAWTYRTFGLRAATKRVRLDNVPLPRGHDAAVAAYVVNELGGRTRDRLREQLVARAQANARVLVVEPIATRIVPWWPEWRAAFEALGGRHDEWRFRLPLPDLIRRFDRASGLRHDELTARSLYIGPANGGPSFDLAQDR